MNKPSILPYFHPTTIVIVDDNNLFLHTLELRLPAEMAYVLHHDARAALQRVNRSPSLAPIPDRCFSNTGSDSAWREPLLQLDSSLIEQEIKNTERFSRVSVVIVDYAMPEMNGLEFCQRIDDRAIKRIMLTGVADEKLAVQAFNEGLIDRFLPKNSSTTLDRVVAYAQDLERAYFVDQQRAFQDSLSLRPPRFLSDPAIAGYFHDLGQQHGFVEHYLVGDPPGFIMLSANGRLFRLIVMSERDSAAQVEFARGKGAPANVISRLSDQSVIGYFFDDPDAVGDEHFDWIDYLHAARIVKGGQTWLTAVVSDPPIDIDFDPAQASFAAYLKV